MVKFNSIKNVLPRLVLILAALFIPVASYLRLFDSYELETLDFRYQVRPKIETTDKVILVEIGEDTIESLGRFPFDRSYHALLVKALSEFGAKAVIFDIFFSESQEHDGELAQAIKGSGKVYLPMVFNLKTSCFSNIPSASGYIARELEIFSSVARGMGHINIRPDVDGKFRRVPLEIEYEGKFYPYVSFLMTADYLGVRQQDIKVHPGKFIEFGHDLMIPLDNQSNMIINFSGKWGKSYGHISYVDILQTYLAPLSGQKPILDKNMFKDKVCIIGLTAAGTVDLHPNPFETLAPGVGIHAEVFNSIVNRQFITRVSPNINVAILLILSLMIAFATLILKPLKALCFLLVGAAIFVITAVLLFVAKGYWIDLFYPVVIMAVVYLSLTLYRYITEWKKRIVIENELDIAKKIQESFLPKSLPAIEGIEIAADMFTARQVGGDLYDFIEFGNRKLGIMIGDVTGKGIPASLFMAMVSSKFKFLANKDISPKEVLASLNSIVVKESSTNLFVTMFYGIFDLDAGTFIYGNGGHLPLLYVKKGKHAEFLDVSDGAPIGLIEGPYSGNSIIFSKGDTFIFYTDGVTEAMNSRNEMYGKERLSSIVESNSELSAKDLLLMIEKDLRRFEPKSHQHDDITLIVLRIT